MERSGGRSTTGSSPAAQWKRADRPSHLGSNLRTAKAPAVFHPSSRQEKRERMRWACEPLLRSGLPSGDLPNDQAETLLDWGLRQMERSVRSTCYLLRSQARILIRSDLDTVRSCMHQVRFLLARRAELDGQELQARLAKLAALSRNLPPTRRVARTGSAQIRRRDRPDRESLVRSSRVGLARARERAPAKEWLRLLLRYMERCRKAAGPRRRHRLPRSPGPVPTIERRG
jgi:hypothetical protein